MERLSRRPLLFRRSCKGAILFVAVGAIAVLSILALGATSSVMQELRLARVLEDASTGTATALTALDITRFFFVKGASGNLAQVTLYDLQDREVPVGRSVLRISFVDEGRWIDLNNASADVLRYLPWLDDDEDLLQAVSGGTFKAVEELRFLENMTPEIYAGMKDQVTIWAPNGVNINTAGIEVLAALGMDENLIGVIREYRAGEDGEEATPDDRQFASTDTILNQLEPLSLSSVQKNVVADLIALRQLTTTSDFLTFHVASGTKTAHRDYTITLQLSSGRVVAWRET